MKKDSEQILRSNGVEGLDINGRDLDTPIPMISDRLLNSGRNKTNTQLLPCDTQTPCHINMILTSILKTGELLKAKRDHGDIPNLNIWIEEADNKVVGHIE